jgi:hypothetical protein
MEWEGFVVPGGESFLTFNNFAPGSGNGNLTVKKELKGEDLNSGKVFKFDVAIRDNAGAAVTSVVPTFSNNGGNTTNAYSIENNVFKITMAAGNQFSFENLPEGYTYEVLETEYDGYLPTIERLYGSFINSQQVTYTVVNYSLGSVNVSAYKNVKNGDKNKQFTISLYLDGALYKSYNLKNGESTGPISIPSGSYYEFVEDNYADYYTGVKYAAGIAYKKNSDNNFEAPKVAEIINTASGDGGNGSGSSDNDTTPTSTPRTPTPTQKSKPNVTFYPTATPKYSGSGDTATPTPTHVWGATSSPTPKQYATSTPKQGNHTATPTPSSGNGNDDDNGGDNDNGGSNDTGTDKGNPKTLNGSADPGMWIALMLGSSVSLRFVTRRKKHLR